MAGLLGCTEAGVGPDTATVCVTAQGVTLGGAVRGMAVFVTQAGVDRVDDVAAVDGRASLTLRPMRADQAERLTVYDTTRISFQTLDLRADLMYESPAGRGVVLQLALYEDVNGSRAYEGGGVDRLLGSTPGDGFHTTIYWMPNMADFLNGLKQWEVPYVLEAFAPGGRPFFHTDVLFAYPWFYQPHEDVTLNAPFWCGEDAWLECPGGEARLSTITLSVLRHDGRIPSRHLLPASEAERFDAAMPQPLFEASTCMSVGAYQVAHRFEARHDYRDCFCERVYADHIVVTMAADPPAWLMCSEPYYGSEGLLHASGLDLEAIDEDTPWWAP